MLFFLLAAGLLPSMAHAQTGMFFGTTYGSYAMGDLKRIQSHYYLAYASSAMTVTNKNFPGSFGYVFELNTRAEKNVFGFFINYTVAAADTKFANSGQTIEFSQKARRGFFGFTDQFDIGRNFALYGKLGICYSHLRLALYSNNQKQMGVPDGFWCMGYSFEPGIQWCRYWGRFQGRVQFGYELNHLNQPQQDDNSTVLLRDYDGRDAGMNWSGLRLGFSVGFKL